jgi:hypothetical protein
MFNRRLVLMAAVATALAAPAFAQSPSQPIVGISSVTTYSADATSARSTPTRAP